MVLKTHNSFFGLKTTTATTIVVLFLLMQHPITTKTETTLITD
jgi:hypothetical protein